MRPGPSGRRRHPPLSSGRPDVYPSVRRPRRADRPGGLDPVGPRSYGPLTSIRRPRRGAMTDLLAIGTRKGLWLARSDDDRRTWTVDGPHLLAQEVAAVCIDTRPPNAAGAGRHPVRPLGPDGHVVRRPRRHLAGDRPRRHPVPRGHRRRAGPRLAAAPRHRRAARRRLGRLRAALAVAQHRRRLHLRAGPRPPRPPAPADLAARRRRRRGAHGAARPGVGPA